MTAQTVEAIDREIATRTEKVAAMSTTMVELDEHPGLQHVKRYPPTGVTAQRWVAIEEALGRMWQDLSSMTSILESARTVRARRSNVTDNDRAELTRLLFERPLEVSRQRIPLAQRSITSRAEAVEYAGLADLAERMRTDYRGAVEFLDSVDQINSAVTTGLAPVQDRLDAVGAASPRELIDLLTVSATDPLSLTPLEVDRRVEVIATAVEKRTAELAEIAALQANWPHEIAATAALLDTLRDNVDRAVRARALAERTVISGPLPVPTDAEPELRAGAAVPRHTGCRRLDGPAATDRDGTAGGERPGGTRPGSARPPHRTRGAAVGVSGEGGPAGLGRGLGSFGVRTDRGGPGVAASV